MKLRQPWLIKTAASGAALLLRAWMSTLRYQCHALGTNAEPPQVPRGTRYIYAFWHEYLLLPAFRYAFTDATVLIGNHADGQLIAEICNRLGMRATRGSTTAPRRQGVVEPAPRNARPHRHHAGRSARSTPPCPARLDLPGIAAGLADRAGRLGLRASLAVPQLGSFCDSTARPPRPLRFRGTDPRARHRRPRHPGGVPSACRGGYYARHRIGGTLGRGENSAVHGAAAARTGLFSSKTGRLGKFYRARLSKPFLEKKQRPASFAFFPRMALK